MRAEVCLRLVMMVTSLCAGCVAMPPPAHFVPIGPLSAAEPGVQTVEVGAAVGAAQVLGATYVHPFRRASGLVCDAGAQVGFTSALATAGITLRTGGQRVEGGHFGVRIGGVAGLGDIDGLSDFRLPFAGPELTLQGGAGFGDGLGAFTVNLGAQALQPLSRAEYTYATTGGELSTAPAAPGYFLSADARVDVPIGARTAFVVGGGFDLALGVSVLPRGAVAVRFAPGPSPGVSRTTPSEAWSQ